MPVSHKSVRSKLLRPEENDLYLAKLGDDCHSLATGVVRMWRSKEPEHREWVVVMEYGVCLLIRDDKRKTYTIRIYKFNNPGVSWEQGLYSTFDYERFGSFVVFEAEGFMAGLSFSDQSEANKLVQALDVLIKNRNDNVKRALAKRQPKQPEQPAEAAQPEEAYGTQEQVGEQQYGQYGGGEMTEGEEFPE